MPTNRVPLLGVAGLMMAAGVAATSGAVSAPATGSPVTAGSAQASSKIAFVSEPVGGGYCGTVYVMNADGSGQRRLTNGGVPGCGQEGVPVWSPDGRRIALTGTPPGDPDPLSADSNIYVVNADGSGQRKLTGGTADGFVLGSPAWSPDGRKIVFAHCTPPACAGERDGLYIVNADGSGERRLTPSGHSPTWLPKGQKLAFMSGFNGNSEIYVVNADGSGQRRLTRNTMGYSHPVWSPDGRRIAFESNWQVWVMNADGSGKRKLTLKGAHNQNPAWSPDGQRIAFERGGRRAVLSYKPGSAGYEVYVMNADGSAQRRLTRGGSQPRWSPDGRTIAYLSKRGGNRDIWIMNTDGSGQRNLTRAAGRRESSPVWSPAQK